MTALPTSPRPHDLLWMTEPDRLRAAPSSDGDPSHDPLADLPWADADWLARAPVVVRRDHGPDGWLPVGLRGPRRRDRCAGWLPTDAVSRCVTPEQLAQAQTWRAPPPALDLPAIATIAHIAPLLDAVGIRWGIGGGAGFALATGLPVLRPDSDLDLIVRADDAETFAHWAAVLRDVLDQPGTARIDIQIDTPAGGFAFAEWLRTGGPVLLKTEHGPVLTSTPWQP